ncbi:MAG: ribosome biogenesis factor YjgA [Burkholderiales bacterium]
MDLPGYQFERPSKTRLKQASHELQALGEALLELPAGKLAAVEMPERLRDALEELRRIRAHEGRRRQLQFVGKLMRDIDPAPLREAVAAQRLPSARESLALHAAESWRERLLAGDDALTAWLDAHPQVDAQALRALIRNARRDTTQAAATQASEGFLARKGRAYRDLFQHVKDTLGEAEAPQDEEPGNE